MCGSIPMEPCDNSGRTHLDTGHRIFKDNRSICGMGLTFSGVISSGA